MDNRYSPYDNSGFQRQPPPHQQPYVNQQHQPPPPQPQQQQQQYRDDYGNNRRGGGGGGGGGAMRDHQRGRRGHNNNNDHRPYNRKPNRQPGGSRNKNDDFDTESASGKEKPCRTLFVRNVQYNTPESAVRDLFIKYGEIKDVFNLIQNRGMIFVTFYDVRAAEEARNSLQNAMLNDRKIDIHYSLPKEEEEKAKCDRSKNQGTLLYTLKNGGSELDDNELHHYFSRFGDIKAIRVPHFKKSTAHQYNPSERNQQRLVEFYDSRACVDAFDATYDTEYNGGKWDVVFFWDYPFRDRQNTHQKRERNHERDDDRSHGRRHSDRYEPPPPSSRYLDNYSDPRLPIKQESPSFRQNDQRLEQAQKAQQMLSMLAHQQAPPPLPNMSSSSPYQQHHYPSSLEPSSTNMSTPSNTTHPYQQYAPPQPDNNATVQVQQLLSLLSQASQQQQVPQQQQPPQQQPPQQQPPQQQQPVAPIPGMDPAAALTQLAALLQQQQQQQQQNR